MLRRSAVSAVALTVLLVGCGGEEPDHVPEAVAPVEVGDDPAEEAARLRARVAELEAELERCHTEGCREASADAEEASAAADPAQTGQVQMEPIPEGVDVPEGVTTPEPVASNGTPARPRERERGEPEDRSIFDLPWMLLGED